jgi:beta-mannanase
VPLKDIAGGAYDASITDWFKQAATYGHPFFFVLDVEMNGTWEPYSVGRNGNTPADFVAMWRHVHQLAVRAKASNVTWVWALNVDPRGMFTPYRSLYPGGRYVDWTGLDGYNSNGRENFPWLFGSSYRTLLQTAPTKPIMITQTGSVEGGNGKAAWITNALARLPTAYPQVKAFLWFNWRINKSGRWFDWEIESSRAAQRAFAAGIASPYFLAGGAFGNLAPGKVPTP